MIFSITVQCKRRLERHDRSRRACWDKKHPPTISVNRVVQVVCFFFFLVVLKLAPRSGAQLCSRSSLTKPELSKPSLDSRPKRSLSPAVCRTLSQVKLWAAFPCQLQDSGPGAAQPCAPGWAQQVPRWAPLAVVAGSQQPRDGHPLGMVLWIRWFPPLHHGLALWGLPGISVQKTNVVSIYREASSFGLEHLQKLLILEQFLFSILTHWLFAFLFPNTLHGFFFSVPFLFCLFFFFLFLFWMFSCRSTPP